MPSSKQVTVLIADDHPISRKGLAESIRHGSEFTVVAEASDGPQAVELFKHHRPDIAVIDLQMPTMDGIGTILAIRTFYPLAKTILLVSTMCEVPILNAFRAGAYGCMMKTMLQGEILEMMREVAKGQRKLAPEISALLAHHALGESLSEREIDVLRGAAKGQSNRIIAAYLGLSEHTVKTHFRSILQKFNASDRTHAVVLALQRGYLVLDDL